MVFIINKANYLLLEYVFLVQYIDQQCHLLHLFVALPSRGSGFRNFWPQRTRGRGQGGHDKERRMEVDIEGGGGTRSEN
jgi:hypothetical protein